MLLAGQTIHDLRGVTVQGLANVAWALAKLEVQPGAPWLDELAQCVTQALPAFKAQVSSTHVTATPSTSSFIQHVTPTAST